MKKKNQNVLNYINYMNKCKKRTRNTITYNNIINELKLSAINRLNNIKLEFLKDNHDNLFVFIKLLKFLFNECIIKLKESNFILDHIKLFIIAELSICKNILHKII